MYFTEYATNRKTFRKNEKKGKKSGGDELDKDSITDLEDPTELYLELAILNWDDKNTDRSLTVIDECEKKYGVDKGMTTLRADILYDRKEYKKDCIWYL